MRVVEPLFERALLQFLSPGNVAQTEGVYAHLVERLDLP